MLTQFALNIKSKTVKVIWNLGDKIKLLTYCRSEHILQMKDYCIHI